MEENKIRVLFPYVEAGMGHIMPMKSFIEMFINVKTAINTSNKITHSLLLIIKYLRQQT